MQRVNCILKIRFNNEKLTTPRGQKRQDKMEHQKFLSAQYVHNVFGHREGVGINV